MLVHEFLTRSAALGPDKVALVCGNRRFSLGALDSLSDRLAGGLRQLGLTRGERAVVQLGGSPEAVIALFAIWKAGGVAVPVHPEVKPEKLARLVRDAAANVVIDGAGAAGASAPRASARSFAELLAAPPACGGCGGCEPGEPRETVGPDELCCLLYTSGSTAQPRGVMLTHGNVDAAAGAILDYLRAGADDVTLDLLPLSFDYGLYNVLMPIRRGATVVLEPGFVHPWQLVGLLAREGVTVLPLVPSLAAGLVMLRSLEGRELRGVGTVTSTGQVLPPPHLARLRQLFPRARIYSMYGLTECKRVSYLPPEEVERRPASVGKAMPGTAAYLVDGGGERLTAPGAVGELVVRGPHVMRGYWGLPAATARMLRPAGEPGAAAGERVLHTGDLFSTDEDGFLYFVARRDDLIKSGGMRVSPREIESVLLELDGVAEAAVCGVPDELLGQAIKAVVTPVEGRTLTAAEVVEHCARRLERYLVPRHVEIRGDLPRTATGKIARRRLHEPEEAVQ